MLWSGAAVAYGPEGHLAAGRVAATLLCERAASFVAEVASGDDLGEVGLWADRIRSEPAYAGSAPWHYVNVAAGERLTDIVHPAEGDVIWAIEHFSERLGNQSLERAARLEALRFLVHFVVDVHQPLHVGFEEDRGGNAVSLRFRRQETNLHRLWDTDAIEWSGLSVAALVSALGEDVAADVDPIVLDPMIWAQESRDLLPAVYEPGFADREVSAEYLDFAARTTRRRLALAARRLAGLLNTILCD